MRVLSQGNLTADAVCDATKIPKSRIYSFLNQLLSLKLIQKSDGFPAEYSVGDVPLVVREFMRTKYEDFIKHEQKLLSLFEDTGANQITIINDDRQLSYEFISGLGECTYCRVISKHESLPFIFYPDDEKEFLKYRELFSTKRHLLTSAQDVDQLRLYRLLKKTLESGKKFEYVVDAESLLYHYSLVKKNYGETAFKRLLAELRKRLSKYGNLSIGVVDEVIPMYVEITDRKVVAVMSNLGYLTGAAIRSRDVVKLYNEFFEETKRRSKPLEEFLFQLEAAVESGDSIGARKPQVIGPVRMPLQLVDQSMSDFRFFLYRFGEDRNYVVARKGNPAGKKNVLVRIESACIFGHLFASKLCDCEWQLKEAMRLINEEGEGIVIYALDQHALGNGLQHHFKIYEEAEKHGNSVGSEVPEKRDYRDVIEILKAHGLSQIRLLTNSPHRLNFLESHGIKVKRIPLEMPVNEYNRMELEMKKKRFGHMLSQV